jgi:hypothetical protein
MLHLILVLSKILSVVESSFGNKTEFMASINLICGSLKKLLSLLQFYQSSQEAINLSLSLTPQVNRVCMYHVKLVEGKINE